MNKEIQERINFLEEFFSQRMETVLEVSLKTDSNYKNAMEIASNAQDKLNNIGLDKEQWQLVDCAISTSNALGSEYGRAAYQQGFLDGIRLVIELYYML